MAILARRWLAVLVCANGVRGFVASSRLAGQPLIRRGGSGSGGGSEAEPDDPLRTLREIQALDGLVMGTIAYDELDTQASTGGGECAITGAVSGGDGMIARALSATSASPGTNAARPPLVLIDRSHWGVLRLGGAGRRAFLHGRTTNDIEGLPGGHSLDASVLDSQVGSRVSAIMAQERV